MFTLAPFNSFSRSKKKWMRSEQEFDISSRTQTNNDNFRGIILRFLSIFQSPHKGRQKKKSQVENTRVCSKTLGDVSMAVYNGSCQTLATSMRRESGVCCWSDGASPITHNTQTDRSQITPQVYCPRAQVLSRIQSSTACKNSFEITINTGYKK